MKSRKLVLGLLIMLAFVVSSFTYAFWASTVTVVGPDTAVGSVSIGEGNEVSTTVSVGNQSEFGFDLVPVTFEAVGDPLADPIILAKVSTIELTFSVNWSGAGAATAAGTLAVTIDEVRTINSNAGVGPFVWTPAASLYGNMFTVTVTSGTGAIVAGTPQDVVLTITFTNEPGSQAIYNQVANGTLEIALTFTVTPTN